MNLVDGNETPVLEIQEGRALLEVDLSWDDRWLAILVGESDYSQEIFVVAIDELASEAQDWVEVVSEDSWIGAPRWSPNGEVLYYISSRDDFLCVWARALDLESEARVGDAFSVVHAHAPAMKLLRFQRTAWTLAVGEGRLVFNATEATGDVYTATLAPD